MVALTGPGGPGTGHGYGYGRKSLWQSDLRTL